MNTNNIINLKMLNFWSKLQIYMIIIIDVISKKFIILILFIIFYLIKN